MITYLSFACFVVFLPAQAEWVTGRKYSDFSLETNFHQFVSIDLVYTLKLASTSQLRLLRQKNALPRVQSVCLILSNISKAAYSA